MTYDRCHELPHLLGHRSLILDDAEIIEALETAVGAAAVHDHIHLAALREALAHERERQHHGERIREEAARHG